MTSITLNWNCRAIKDVEMYERNKRVYSVKENEVVTLETISTSNLVRIRTRNSSVYYLGVDKFFANFKIEA